MNHCLKIFRIPVLALALFTICLAAPGGESQREIAQLYERSCRAAAFKYLPAMLSHRSSEFKAYGPDEREINTLGEESKLQSLLNAALSVEESVEIVSSQSTENGQVRCHVKDRLEIRLLNPASKTGQGLVILTESKDLWTKTPLGWRQIESRILKQNVEEPKKTDV